MKSRTSEGTTNAPAMVMRFYPALLIAACATTTTTMPPPGGPRGLRATEHRDVATVHDEAARNQTSWPRTTAMTPGDPTTPQIMPWYRTWNTATEHERLARIHRSEAGALEAAYTEACGTRDLKKIVGSPLTRHRIGGWNTSTGAIVYLSPAAGTAETLLADLRCHRAWMMLAPVGSMDDCPLDLPGLHIDARGDQGAITLVITVHEPKLVLELQRRLAKQNEQVEHEHHEE
jgi:hypothetical protein